MFLLTLVFILFSLVIYSLAAIVWKVIYRFRIEKLIENIQTKTDLQDIFFKDLPYVMIEVFRRKGYYAKMTNTCGEDGNGLILNNIQMVEVYKHALNQVVEVETAMKLAKCMQKQSIYRGMLITLGDFKHNTRAYCHKNVISCINGEQFLDLCKEVQRRNRILETYQ